jgi:hypothetical protein
VTPPEQDAPPAEPPEEPGDDDEGRDGSPRADAILEYLGEDLPSVRDDSQLTLPGFTGRIPAEWPRHFESKENPRQITLFVDNWYPAVAEVYQIDQNGQPVGRGRPEANTSLEISTRQGNVFVFFTADGSYFGHYTTTGESTQRVRLVEVDDSRRNNRGR